MAPHVQRRNDSSETGYRGLITALIVLVIVIVFCLILLLVIRKNKRKRRNADPEVTAEKALPKVPKGSKGKYTRLEDELDGAEGGVWSHTMERNSESMTGREEWIRGVNDRTRDVEGRGQYGTVGLQGQQEEMDRYEPISLDDRAATTAPPPMKDVYR
ncbi:hypothetical protein BKA66DRAFT_438042 [Pyrenochaeta sp. MPI-SDFR-AT-0127]|nr:hypothetical protein BKA66DRAFT_438042 [Pyrenochaeta sp. MPI-SDFR-AT-0127]